MSLFIVADNSERLELAKKAYNVTNFKEKRNMFSRCCVFQVSLEQQSAGAGRPVRIEILEPEVKQLLESCAKYNLEGSNRTEDDSCSAEVLEEIRHAEAVETLRKNKGVARAVAKPASLPNSPFKNGTKAREQVSESNASLYDNSGKHMPQEFLNLIAVNFCGQMQ